MSSSLTSPTRELFGWCVVACPGSASREEEIHDLNGAVAQG